MDAFDIDPIAVRATQENAALNDLPVPIHVVVSAGPGEGSLWRRPTATPDLGRHPGQHPAARHRRPAGSGLHTYLAPGGRMILAGIIEEREPDVRAALAEHGLAVVRAAQQGRLGGAGGGGWVKEVRA